MKEYYKIDAGKLNEVAMEDYPEGYWHRFPEEAPEADRLLYVIDGKGATQGHLSTKIVWDGERFRTDLGHTLLVDADDIVGWRYLDER